MVKFGDFSVIRTAIDTSFSAFHVVSYISENTILVTEGTHVATVYDLSSRSSLRSWCFPESSPLSAPVVFDEKLDKFIAVQQNSVILCFDLNEDISEASKIKPSHGVYCVFGHSKLRTFVLFQNGCFKSLNQLNHKNSIEDSESLLKPNEIIIWAQICSSNADEIDLFLITEKETVNCVHEITFDTNNEKVKKCSNFQLSEKYNLFALNKENKSVLGLDSKSTLVELRNEELIMKFPNDYKKRVNSIACMSQNKLIATVRVKSENDVFKLEIWDLNFKLVISEIALDLIPLPNAIGIRESNIFVCCSKGITVTPFDVRNVSLASVLGKAATVKEKDFTLETDLKEIPKKVASSAPQERERLQTLALDIALKAGESMDRDALMDAIKHPFCELFAIKSLKTLKYTTEEVVKLLEMLNKSLTEVNKLFVVDWMCAIIDAYFKQLILSSNKETSSVLNNVLKTVEKISVYCERLQELRYFVEGYGLTDRLTEIPRIELPQYNVGQYCIEIVYF